MKNQNWTGKEWKKQKLAEQLMAVMLFAAVFLVSRQAGLMVSSQNVTAKNHQPVVVLDSGHGGMDPGKIGVDGSLEKDINLQIARKLKVYHQEPISGGQVFYYKTSERGKRLAEILQRRFDSVLGEKNTRQAKPNGNYYLLLHVKQPIVIVECGFLSNWNEAAKLQEEEYQDRLAWTIHMGVMEYLTQK